MTSTSLVVLASFREDAISGEDTFVDGMALGRGLVLEA